MYNIIQLTLLFYRTTYDVFHVHSAILLSWHTQADDRRLVSLEVHHLPDVSRMEGVA